MGFWLFLVGHSNLHVLCDAEMDLSGIRIAGSFKGSSKQLPMAHSLTLRAWEMGTWWPGRQKGFVSSKWWWEDHTPTLGSEVLHMNCRTILPCMGRPHVSSRGCWDASWIQVRGRWGVRILLLKHHAENLINSISFIWIIFPLFTSSFLTWLMFVLITNWFQCT